MVAQALSKKAGVEFSIADISGDDLMSQREALATQGVKVRWILTQMLYNGNCPGMTLLESSIITILNSGDVFWETSSKHNQLHERLLRRRTYPECFEQVVYHGYV